MADGDNTHQEIQVELGFNQMIEEMRQFKGTPRVYWVTNFVDIQTVVVHFDRFVGILNYSPNLDDMVYTAFGRSPNDDLSDNNLHIVDMKMIKDNALWVKGNTQFVNMFKNHAPDHTQEITGGWDREVVLTHIVDLWKYIDERDNAVIH